jgi:hypothetical protein
MRRTIRRRGATLAAFCLTAVVTGAPGLGAEVVSSPTDVRPLLIGTEVPSVDVLRLDGTAVNLRDVVGDEKAVVIFYRGGW